MRRVRRLVERLFYWPTRQRERRGPSTSPSDRFAHRSTRLRMTGILSLILVALAMGSAMAAGPALTTISDTVYRADGKPAGGAVLIAWPAFQTSEGDPVAAGNQSVTIGTGGAFTTQLVPNAGASPAGTLYTVVYQLNDYTVRAEFWSVPATATTTITAIRTTPGVGMANPAATQQYVNAAVANRALDSQVVHLAGGETISGTKQFSVSPVLPAPVGNNDAAPKSYVDQAVSNVGAGSFVAKAGDTMSGPLSLPADPANPASQVAPATVLYDDVIPNAPGFCTYALVNAATMQCSITFTYLFLAIDALVRSTLPGQSTRTRRTGSLREGAECHVSNEPALQFYPQYIPAANETITVTYRGRSHARGRVTNSASIAALQRGGDDGVRGGVRQIALPVARTSVDCETAALALLDDDGQGWTGEYQAWSPFLPGGAGDIFPGNALTVDAPSRSAAFTAIVHEVAIDLVDFDGENSRYTLKFVDAADPALDFEFQTWTAKQATALAATELSAVGSVFLPDLTAASVTNVGSTTVTIDAGFAPGPGEGVEVRSSDAGWGPDNDRNLAGRFSARSFTLPRFSRAQDYFLRRYDGSSPPKYSRFSAGVHVDWPL